MSKIRKVYFTKLVARITILLASLILYFYAPGQFEIVEGWNFFKKFSVFHILWAVWISEMVTQLMPVKNIALGSQKFFKEKFRVDVTCIVYKYCIMEHFRTGKVRKKHTDSYGKKKQRLKALYDSKIAKNE